MPEAKNSRRPSSVEENAIEINNDCSSCICRLLAQTKTVGRSKGNWQWHWYVSTTLCTLYCICLHRCYFWLENHRNWIPSMPTHHLQRACFLGEWNKQKKFQMEIGRFEMWFFFSNWRIVISEMEWHEWNSNFIITMVSNQKNTCVNLCNTV